MITNWAGIRRFFILLIPAFFMVLYCPGPVHAEILMDRVLSFGNITAAPSGAAVLLDASSGDTVPIALDSSKAIVTDGQAGILKLVGFEGMNIVVYFNPSVVTLSCDEGGTVSISDMSKYSESDPLNSGNADELFIGGQVNIMPGASGMCSGTVTITIDVL